MGNLAGNDTSYRRNSHSYRLFVLYPSPVNRNVRGILHLEGRIPRTSLGNFPAAGNSGCLRKYLPIDRTYLFAFTGDGRSPLPFHLLIYPIRVVGEIFRSGRGDRVSPDDHFSPRADRVSIASNDRCCPAHLHRHGSFFKMLQMA